MTIVVEILVFIGVFVALNGFIGWWKDQMKAKLNGLRPPAFPSLPLLGSLPFIRNWDNVPEFFLRATNRLGPIFTLKVGHKYEYFLIFN